MSTDPMTQGQLDTIRRRTEKATEGQWGVEGPAQCGPSDTLVVYPVEDGGTLAYVQPSWEDAEFIAHAREDVPALLAEVERLRALTTVDDDMVERAVEAHRETFNAWPVKRSPEDSYHRRVAAMRAALNAALGTKEEA